ncbi:MAG TPA: SpoIID/LytB domain-containing protein [Trueperaceae bacterium]
MSPRSVVCRVLVMLLLGSSAYAQEVQVRVLLERAHDEVRIHIDEGHRGYADGALIFDTSLGIAWPIDSVASEINVDGMRVGRSFMLAPHSGVVEWDGSTYRGALRFVADGDELLVVNVLGLEEYLRGVVPAEMAAAWPLEALKAQSVASRTYTLISLEPTEPFDICATVECQAYDGVAAEHRRSDTAIAQTAGLVLTYGGEFAHTYYHSDSGGELASSAEVWGTPYPYLASRVDVTSTTPHRHWRHVIDPDRMGRTLATLGHHVGTVRSLRVLAYSESGRVLRAEVAGSEGQIILGGSTLTSLLRESGFKSTRFTMVGDLVARGDGFGHGVGMSQYGARSLARAGYGFEQILRFYYPDTLLQRLAPAHADGS